MHALALGGLQTDKSIFSFPEKYLAQYHKAPKNGAPKSYSEKSNGFLNPLSENLCASLCKNTENCETFDFCVGRPLDKSMDDLDERKAFGCYLHDKDAANDKQTDEDKWEAGTYCNHYTGKRFPWFH